MIDKDERRPSYKNPPPKAIGNSEIEEDPEAPVIAVEPQRLSS